MSWIVCMRNGVEIVSWFVAMIQWITGSECLADQLKKNTTSFSHAFVCCLALNFRLRDLAHELRAKQLLSFISWWQRLLQPRCDEPWQEVVFADNAEGKVTVRSSSLENYEFCCDCIQAEMYAESLPFPPCVNGQFHMQAIHQAQDRVEKSWRFVRLSPCLNCMFGNTLHSHACFGRSHDKYSSCCYIGYVWDDSYSRRCSYRLLIEGKYILVPVSLCLIAISNPCRMLESMSNIHVHYSTTYNLNLLGTDLLYDQRMKQGLSWRGFSLWLSQTS